MPEAYRLMTEDGCESGLDETAHEDKPEIYVLGFFTDPIFNPVGVVRVGMQ